LGDGPNSKMFQNVREKEGLAYSARSNFIYQKMNIFIRLGIMQKNYDKALSLSLKQIDDIKVGKFSDEDLENAKTYLIAGIRSLKEDQDAILLFYYGKELSGDKVTLEEYEETIKKVTREDVIEFSNGISINTIYYLNAIEEIGE
jgi:predicted Zn-dependent peptidase